MPGELIYICDEQLTESGHKLQEGEVVNQREEVYCAAKRACQLSQ